MSDSSLKAAQNTRVLPGVADTLGNNYSLRVTQCGGPSYVAMQDIYSRPVNPNSLNREAVDAQSINARTNPVSSLMGRVVDNAMDGLYRDIYAAVPYFDGLGVGRNRIRNQLGRPGGQYVNMSNMRIISEQNLPSTVRDEETALMHGPGSTQNQFVRAQFNYTNPKSPTACGGISVNSSNTYFGAVKKQVAPYN